MQAVSRFSVMTMPTRPASAAAPDPGAVVSRHLQTQLTKTPAAGKPDSGGLSDIMDIINPLQHIPVVSTLYRKWTGDEIGHVSRIAGGALYGGVFGSLISGLVSALANVFVEATTGRDVGAHVMAAASPDGIPPASGSQAMDGAEAARRDNRTESGKQPFRFAEEMRGPAQEFSPVQSAIDRYKWHVLDDEAEERPGYWA